MDRKDLKRDIRLLDEHERWLSAQAWTISTTAKYRVKVSVDDSGPLHTNDYDEEVPQYVVDAVSRFIAEKVAETEAALNKLGIAYRRQKADV